ncbi:MAG: flagellar hook-basal body complex protein FliE [Myxococcota bacterium]
MKPLSFNGLENPGVEIARPASRADRTAEVDAKGDGFGEALKTAIEKVDAMQTDADVEAQKLGNGEGNLHETMLALEKADVAMRVAMKVRNKFLEAYNEVMRMPV